MNIRWRFEKKILLKILHEVVLVLKELNRTSSSYIKEISPLRVNFESSKSQLGLQIYKFPLLLWIWYIEVRYTYKIIYMYIINVFLMMMTHFWINKDVNDVNIRSRSDWIIAWTVIFPLLVDFEGTGEKFIISISFANCYMQNQSNY